jgi:alpha-ketoglutaric semialdehyde dehydrogenase
MNNFKDASAAEIDEALLQSKFAFDEYSQVTLQQRANVLRLIAEGLHQNKESLVSIAHQETHLEKSRLHTELQRTGFQLTSYAKACEQGNWLDVRIDLPQAPSEHDLRKMLVPLGPVVVFGASNFPFAYSTAGGDTACALAAGCTVVVKAHGAHAETSTQVAAIIDNAIEKAGMPKRIFKHLYGASLEVGQALVQHPYTKAVSFTGSLQGGRALFDLAAQRPVPIPVFAEMGSINPVFILPQKLAASAGEIAYMYAQSITNSAGQFCTSPGLMVVIKSKALENFTVQLAQNLTKVAGVPMLHAGIVQAFHTGRKKALGTKGVELLTPVNECNEELSLPTLAQTSAAHFIKNKDLQHEVFGPYCLMVVCNNREEMLQVANALDGQLTTSLMATEKEAAAHPKLLQALQQMCGRTILNNVPTGVQVALAMQHGGPYPATTDSRFTSVGADGIKRFARPLCFQNWSNHLLPDALKNENPLNLWRTVNNNLTKEAIVLRSEK